jgi:hypothetical protein
VLKCLIFHSVSSLRDRCEAHRIDRNWSGGFRYKLNHFALSSDPSGKLIRPARIQEDVFLDHHGDSYSGTFTIDQYDLSGSLLVHLQGQITATRIRVDTPVEDVL